MQWYYAMKAAQRHSPPALGLHPGVFLILVAVGKHEPNKDGQETKASSGSKSLG